MMNEQTGPVIPVSETRTVLDKLAKLYINEGERFLSWNTSLNSIDQRLSESVVRLAVIGTVKAGKTSLINSLLKQDTLRRGAGILTSIITRVRFGRVPGATIQFKSWKMVNDEAQSAYTVLAQITDHALDRSLDIRKNEDREFLKEFLESHPVKLADSGEQFNQEWTLLQMFLKGYDFVYPQMKDGESVLQLDEEELVKHQQFVSNEEYAVYLQDVLLKMPGLWDHHLELADCQGSDSPNPIHFAKVQEFLTRCSLVLYVVSSRTGIRQGDVALLKTLDQLGLLGNVIFVTNLDMNEHESIEDSKRILDQLTVDLNRWVAEPKVFAVSALYQLFTVLRVQRTPRMDAQMQLWESVSSLTDYHKEQWTAFDLYLKQDILRHVNRVVQSGESSHWSYLVRTVLGFMDDTKKVVTQDLKQVNREQSEMKARHEELSSALKSLNTSLDGALTHTKKQLDKEVNRIFETSASSFAARLIDAVQAYQLPPDLMHSKISANKWLVLFHKNMQAHILRYVTDELNVPLISELKALQKEFAKQYYQACLPFLRLIKTSGKNGAGEDQKESMNHQPPLAAPIDFPDLPFVTFTTTLSCSPGDKLKNVMLLGKNMVQSRWKGWRSGEKELTTHGQHKLFQDECLNQLKKNAAESLRFDILNYKENIKYMYMLKGLSSIVESLKQDLKQKIETACVDFNALRESVVSSDSSKTDAMLTEIDKLTTELNGLLHSTLPDISKNQ